MENNMAKRLSEQLADLSVRAKSTEEAVDAAAKEAHEKLMARKEQARAAAQKALEKLSEAIKSAAESAPRDWASVKAKIAADLKALQADVAVRKREFDIKRAESHAD